MAKVIKTEVDSEVITSGFPFLKIIIVGLISGFLFWLFTLLIGMYLSRSESCALTVCSEFIGTASGVASILVVLVGIIMMIKLKMVQPLIVAVATAMALWGLANWTYGLKVWEVITWSLMTYLISYLLFSWIVRYDKFWPVLITILVIITIVRIVANI